MFARETFGEKKSPLPAARDVVHILDRLPSGKCMLRAANRAPKAKFAFASEYSTLYYVRLH